MRRKKRWMNRDDYGFEMVDHDDNDEYPASRGMNGHANSGSGSRRQRRAGELYDAFAEDTDDEAEMFNLESEEESGDEDESERRGREKEMSPYRDDEPLREGSDVR